MQTEDGEIVYKCLNGKPEAFGFLVDKYRESIFAFAYSELHNFHDAEDITQEVFIKAYQKLNTLRHYDRFIAWLYSITSRLCKNLIRSRQNRPDHDYVEDLALEALMIPSMDSYREDIAIKTLNEALDSLPELYSQALTLHYLGGMSIKEIAVFLGTSINAIKHRLSRARMQLKGEVLEIMSETFSQQKLKAGFTFRIVEAVKKIRINPLSQTKGLPWGISLVTGIIIAVLNFSIHINPLDVPGKPAGFPLPAESAVLKTGEIPVDVLKISNMSLISSQKFKGRGGESEFVEQQSAFFLAPGGEGVKIPEKPSGRLGKGVASGVAYSPDGRLLAVAGGLGIWLYDAVNLNEVGLLEGDTGMNAIAFSMDSKLLASCSWDKTIRLWDIASQKQVGLLQGHTDWVNSVAFSPNGKVLASCSDDKTIRIWDVQEQKQIAMLEGHTGRVARVALSPDGKLLASGGGWDVDNQKYDTTIRLWDVDSQKQVGLLQGHISGVNSIAFSPDGKIMASGSWDTTIRLWDVVGQNQVGLLQGHTDAVFSIVFSPGGKIMASGSRDKTVRLWDIDGQKQVGLLQGHTDHVSSIAFAPDGRSIASLGKDGTLRIWDIDGQKQVRILQGYTAGVNSIAFSPDGKTLASGGYDKVRLWDVPGQKQIGLLLGHTDIIRSVAFSPDGKVLASGSEDNTVRLWDIAGQKQVGLLKGHTGWVWSVAFSPDGEMLASGSWDNTIRLWDVVSQKQVGLLQGHTSYVMSIAFSPDGRMLASCSGDPTIRLWDVKKRSQIGLLQGHTGWVYSVAFSPDGESLASSSVDKTVRFWDVEEQSQVGLLQHPGLVYSVAFSPDGKILASGSEGNTVNLWDTVQQKQIGLLLGHKSIASSIAFSPDGKWLASGSQDGTILLWEMNLPVPGKVVEPKGKRLAKWGEVKKTALYQNFPNPFNPETWIPFYLSEPEQVTIRIYSSTGQLVRTLDLGQKPSGEHLSKEKAAYWDGRNSKGEYVSSGVYWYIMEAGSFRATKKMVIAR